MTVPILQRLSLQVQHRRGMPFQSSTDGIRIVTTLYIAAMERFYKSHKVAFGAARSRRDYSACSIRKEGMYYMRRSTFRLLAKLQYELITAI